MTTGDYITNSSANLNDNDTEEDYEESTIASPKGWGVRHTFTLLSFLGFVNLYAMRVNLSVAIVAMVKNSTNNATSGSTDDKFDWDTNQQAIILGSFFYGYIITQIPGGFLAEKYGGKWLFGFGTLVTALISFITPTAARAGLPFLIATRVITGFAEGVTFPTIHAMISTWLPKKNRNKLSSFIWTGGNCGTVISMPLTGILAEKLGWPSVFYFFGACGVVWFLFWVYFVYDNPEKHPRISPDERAFIIAGCQKNRVVNFPPLKIIFLDPAFLCIIVAHMGQNWGSYTLLMLLPTYLKQIHHFSLKENGLISALPSLAMWSLSVPFGVLADVLINRRIASVAITRKIMNSIAFFGASLMLLILAFSEAGKVLTVVCLCVSVGVGAACFSAFQINHVDLSPNYAGTLMGITNMFGNVCGFLAPQMVGHITLDNQTVEAWQNIFLINGTIYIVTNVIYVIFAKGETRKWN